MKYIFLFVLLLACSAAMSQTPPSNYTQLNSNYQWNLGRFKGFALPARDTSFLTGQWRIAGTIVYDSTISKGYIWTGAYWQEIGSGAGGGSSSPDSILLNNTTLRVATNDTLQRWAEQADSALFRARGTGVAVQKDYVTLTVGGTTFNVAAGAGEITLRDGGTSPDRYHSVVWGASTGVTITDLSQGNTWVYIDTTGTVRQQTTTPTAQDENTKIFLARIPTNGSVTLAVVPWQTVLSNIAVQLRQLSDFFPYRKTGLVLAANADLTFNVSTGKILSFGTGSAFEPNAESMTATTPTTFSTWIRTGNSVASGQTNVPVTQYDNAGVLTTMTNNRFVIHKIRKYTSGNVTLQYGQAEYVSLAAAEQALASVGYSYVDNPLLTNGATIGYIIVQKNATDLTDAATAYVYTTSPSGDASGGISGSVSFGGISSVNADFGLLQVNDSTLAVDTTVITTKADRNHLKDSLVGLLGILRPVRITNANFSSATEYDDTEFAAGVKISIFVNELNRFLDSATEYRQTVTGIEFLLPDFDAINNTYNILIWKVRDGVAGIGLPVNLSLPYNIEQAIDYRVRRRPDGTFYTTYDWDAVKNSITGSEIWVNPVTGNDANAGTEGSPKKSISWVLNFTTANVVHLAPGWYNYEEAFNGVDINRNIKFLCNGIAYVTTSDTVGAWSAVVGNPGAYESTYTGPSAIESPVACDFSNKDENGVPIRLTPVTSISAVASTANSVYAVPGTNKFYAHTYDDRAPDDSIKVFFEKNAVEVFAPYTVYFENIRFMGGGSSGRSLFWADNTTGSGRITVVMKNCWVAYALTDGTGNYRDVTGFYKDCIFAYNGEDGNDWDKTCIGLEEDCVGYFNGYGTNDANNGSTAHGNTLLVRVNGVHKYNGGRNVHDIEEATSYNVNLAVDSSRGTGGSNYAFGTSSPLSLNTTMYFIDCTSEETKGWDIRTTNGHAFYYNSNQESTTNNVVGDTITLSGYQFDPYPIVTSATVTSATQITIKFSEPVTATTSGWSFKVNGASQTPSAVAGSGTSTLVFTVTTITSSDVVQRTYSMSTGNTIDAAGNELVNFTDNTVTIGI